MHSNASLPGGVWQIADLAVTGRQCRDLKTNASSSDGAPFDISHSHHTSHLHLGTHPAMDTDSPFTLRPLRDLDDGSLQLADLSLADETLDAGPSHPLGLPPPARASTTRAPFRPQDPSLTASLASQDASVRSSARSSARSSPNPGPRAHGHAEGEEGEGREGEEKEDAAARDERLRASLAELRRINGVMDSFLNALVAAKGHNEVRCERELAQAARGRADTSAWRKRSGRAARCSTTTSGS